MRFWRKWIAAGQARVFLADRTTAGKLTGALIFAMSLLATPSLAQQDIDALRAELFRNPANIQTNLAYLQSQLAEGNYTGAAATLQRVLMVDPESKLARVLYAEVQLRLGNKSDARLALDELIADPTTPADMRARARSILRQLDQSEKRLGFQTSIAIAGGSSDNALGAPSASQILYLDRSFDNTTLEVSEAFTDYDLLVGFTYAPQSYVSQSFMVNVGIAGRQFASLEALNSHSTFGTLSYMRAGRTAVSVGLTGYSTQVNDADYSGGARLVFGASRAIGSRVEVNGNFTAGLLRYQAGSGLAIASQRDSTSARLAFGAGYKLRLFGMAATLGLHGGHETVAAKADYFSTATTNTGLSLSFLSNNGQIQISADQFAVDYDAADPLVSTLVREDELERISAYFGRTIRPRFVGPVTIFLSAISTDSTSNLPNFTRTVSEAKLGFRKAF